MKNLNTKQAILYGLLLFMFVSTKAQINLVPDPSFEDTSNSVIGMSGQLSLNQWRNLDSSRPYLMNFTYFSYNTLNPPYSLPNNQWCYQNAHSGGGVAEFTSIWGLSLWRALARTKLKSPLSSGRTYCAKMYVNPEEKYFGYFADGIAMYLDNGQLDTIVSMDSSGVYPFVNPQVSNPSGNVLSDTMNWVTVSGTFVANGTETFLTIGNFKTDANTVKVFNPTTYIPPDTIYASGLLIDDVSIIPVDISNWLHDTTIVLGDSVSIGLPMYEVPDASWYDINLNYISKGSGIKVKPTQWATQYIQAIDVCSSIRYDTMTVWAAPLAIDQLDYGAIRQFVIYPNPTFGDFSIRVNESFMNATLRIVNITGETILQREGLNGKSFTFDISDKAKGVYFVEIKTDSGIKRMKLLKE